MIENVKLMLVYLLILSQQNPETGEEAHQYAIMSSIEATMTVDFLLLLQITWKAKQVMKMVSKNVNDRKRAHFW